MLAELVDLALPSPCPGCGHGPRMSGGCPRCRMALLEPTSLCRVLPVGSGQLVHAAAAYHGAVRALLVARKERGARGLDPSLGAGLALATAAALGAAPRGGAPSTTRIALVPAPSGRAAVRRRGQDTVAALATAAARTLSRCGVTAEVAPVLRYARPVVDSAGLDAAARHRNLDGAMGVACRDRALLGSRVVVVDDLCTTGATLAEACRALTRAGVVAESAAVVALVP